MFIPIKMNSIPSLNWLDISIRLVAAAVLAGIVGIDREVRDKPAGLRTYMLVGLGAAAFTVFASNLVHDLAAAGDQTGIRLDPTRIIQGIIGGLGFLGAGTIIHSRGDVHGITTAAGIWIAGAIGLGCGAAYYFTAFLVTLIAVICLIPVQFLEYKLVNRRNTTPTDTPK